MELKLNAPHRCFELGEDVQLVEDELGYSTASIYTYLVKKIYPERCGALMNRSDKRPRGRLEEGTPVSAKELETLKEQIEVPAKLS